MLSVKSKKILALFTVILLTLTCQSISTTDFENNDYSENDEYLLVIGVFAEEDNALNFSNYHNAKYIKENDRFFVFSEKEKNSDLIRVKKSNSKLESWIKKIVNKDDNNNFRQKKSTIDSESEKTDSLIKADSVNFSKANINTIDSIKSKKINDTSHSYFNYQIGDIGPIIKEIQKYLDIQIDGFFGKQTKNAVLKFQEENSLTANGEVNTKTFLLMKLKYNTNLENEDKTTKFKNFRLFEIGDQDELIKTIQFKLKLTPNGFFCKQTEKKIIEFQKLNNLVSNGKVDKNTFELLFFEEKTTNTLPLKTSLDGINFIKEHEGFSAKAYQDQAGVWTIGYGSTTNMLYKQINKSDSISLSLAEKYLLFYINEICEPNIKKHVKVNLNQNEFDALVSFVYNVGPTNFRNSTLLKKLNLGKKIEAYNELIKWIRVNNEPNAGIYKRRLEEKKLATTPVSYKINETYTIDSLNFSNSANKNQEEFVAQCVINDKCFSLPTDINPEENIIKKIKDWFNSKKDKKAYFDRTPKYQIHYSDFRFYLSNFSDSSQISEAEWSNLQRKIIFRKNVNQKTNKNKKIYAFHPYWMGNSYLNYPTHLINRIGYYGYIINPYDGSDLSSKNSNLANGFTSQYLKEYSEKNKIYIDLVVGSYDIKNNIEIFEPTKRASKVRCNAIYNIVNLVQKNGNGVCFDIQKVPVKYKQQYINMIYEISERLDTDLDKKYKISVIIPTFDVGVPHNFNLQDYKFLKDIVDVWILQPSSNYKKYDEDNAINKLWDVNNISEKINTLPQEVSDKLIYEIDFVQTKINDEDSSLKILPYHQLKELDSLEAFKMYEQTRIKLQNLQMLKARNNLAIWSPGYDNNYEDMLSLIEFYFNENDLRIDPKNLTDLNKDLNVLKTEEPFIKQDKKNFINSLNIDKLIDPYIKIEKPKTINNNTLIIIILSTIIFFIMLGFIIALFFEFSREKILQFNNLGYFILILFITSAIIYLNSINFISNESFLLVGGVMIGIIISYPFISKRKNQQQKELRP